MVEVVSFRKALSLSLVRGEIVKRLYEQEVLTSKEIADITPSYRTVMHYLRSLLRSYGIEVKSQQKLGYWLDKDAKERVKTLVGNILPGQGETVGGLDPQPSTASEPQ